MRIIDEDYALLGVQRGATSAEIKAAWRKLAFQWHPDVAPQELKDLYTQRFKAIQAAYQRIKKENFEARKREEERRQDRDLTRIWLTEPEVIIYVLSMTWPSRRKGK